MLHPDEIEDAEYEMNARADYLSEAFGAEARLLAREAEYPDMPPTEENNHALDLYAARMWVDCFVIRNPAVPF